MADSVQGQPFRDSLQGFNVAVQTFLGVQPNVSSEIATLADLWNSIDLA